MTGFCAIGNLSIDDLVFVDGTTQWAVPGGNAVYSALGMAVWGERPIVVAPFGPDYPVGPLEARIELSGEPRLNRTLRDWGLYEEDGSRQFVFRSSTRNWEEFSPTAGDVLPGIPAAHLAPLPWHRHVELVAALRAAGTTIVSVDLDDRRLAEVARDDVVRLMASVDLFLPSRQDGRVIVPNASAADTVRHLRELSPETPLIVLKCGADGCVAHAKGGPELLILPAVPVEATDATGAGDTFCGGALVGYARTRDPFQALLHGAVSASFCVAAVGVKGLLEADPAEAERRRGALAGSAQTQAF
jgi:sugar/nucleoside kinase (ribokinase family)